MLYVRTKQPRSYLTVEVNVVELHVGVKAQMFRDGAVERRRNEHGICNMTDMSQEILIYLHLLGSNLSYVLLGAQSVQNHE